jgi:hypothetical protein
MTPGWLPSGSPFDSNGDSNRISGAPSRACRAPCASLPATRARRWSSSPRYPSDRRSPGPRVRRPKIEQQCHGCMPEIMKPRRAQASGPPDLVPTPAQIVRLHRGTAARWENESAIFPIRPRRSTFGGLPLLMGPQRVQAHRGKRSVRPGDHQEPRACPRIRQLGPIPGSQ